MLVALWRAVDVEAGACHARVLDEWAPIALKSSAVRRCRVSVAEPDQGIYAAPPDARGLVPNCDVLIASRPRTAPTTSTTFPNRDALLRDSRAR